MTQTNITTAGIDTSKAKLDIAVHGRSERWQVANQPAGWRELAGKLTGADVTRVGIEATGGYERGVVEHLRAAGFTVLLLQPLQVKAFGQVHLRRAKNDALDAVLIAACAAVQRGGVGVNAGPGRCDGGVARAQRWCDVTRGSAGGGIVFWRRRIRIAVFIGWAGGVGCLDSAPSFIADRNPP